MLFGVWYIRFRQRIKYLFLLYFNITRRDNVNKNVVFISQMVTALNVQIETGAENIKFLMKT